MSEISLIPERNPALAMGQAGLSRFEAFFHASPHGILILDDTGLILEANEQAGMMFGYRHDSIPGVKFLQFLDPSTWDQVNQAFIQTQFSGNALVETQVIRADESSFPAEIIWNRLRSEGRILYHGSISNISSRNVALEESRRAIKTAQEANEARLLFLATMSHEIRTPLNGIIGFAHLLADSELSELQEQYVDMVGRSGDILLRIIDDILHLSRIESGRFELEEIDFDPATCIEEVFEMHSSNNKLEKVELLYEVLEGVPALVRGDITRTRQILTNLVSNALKFTEEGHILVRCAVQDGRYLAFSVRDTGNGFDAAKTETLFKPFFQEDASTTRKFGGTGLGLAICRKLVNRMGGYIEARSDPGVGAEFWFGIPLIAAPESLTTPPPLAGYHAILVGGSSPGNELLRKRLAKSGLEAHAVLSAEAALTTLKKRQCHLILVDHNGGGMRIEEFAKKAKKTKPNRKSIFILLSPARSQIGSEPASAMGYATVLTTPIRQEDLLSGIVPLLRPVQVVPEVAEEPKSPPPRKAKGKPKPNPLILIAEDNHINAQLALLVTKRLGFDAHVAHNGREVLAYLASEQSYTAILMDMRMPDMDGIEATRRIRLGHAGVPVTHIPIYALTANAMNSDRDSCINAGMNGYFAKPLRIKEIEDAFRVHGLLPSE